MQYYFPGAGKIGFGFKGYFGMTPWPTYRWSVECEDGEEIRQHTQLGSSPSLGVLRNAYLDLRGKKNKQEFYQLYEDAVSGRINIEFFRIDVERPDYAYYSSYPWGYRPDGTLFPKMT